MKKPIVIIVVFLMSLLAWGETGIYFNVSGKTNLFQKNDELVLCEDLENKQKIGISASMYRPDFFEVKMSYLNESSFDGEKLNLIMISLMKIFTLNIGTSFSVDAGAGFYVGGTPHSYIDLNDNEVSEFVLDYGLEASVKARIVIKKGFLKSVDIGFRYMMSMANTYKANEDIRVERIGFFVGGSF